ncbi:SAM-dependent methyltransferase [Vulcanisaeta distributa]|uniref:uroporphyrinogen-III C-methyltransferase n=1 Tax=Vulcanisaeta distributa (strain DSM 14429 / JCM 11212 / NBRC 100878 / IC-017) TaxID=572478 RepID=E1QPG5_VULDI|nr:SAM-dependent methyltransferase [Vulcanisaeta distributa]ADN51453.1 Uroporphyrin-III C/tetrapyrrole (Corrin/Porphyrin) methyltransferase [Vulcanisaeta distributa DSM 14429]
MIIIPIYVVGAGPWDPELITVKAIKILSKADVVFYGSLVNEEIINTYAPNARKVFMGHVRGDAHREYVIKAIELARKGLNVVFLKNGDPVIFGRGIEICREALRNGVPCEIVPGVSSFTAAAAKYMIELKGVVALMAYPDIDYDVKADVKVVFMGTRMIKELISKLNDDHEILIVSRVTYPDEEFHRLNNSSNIDDVKAPSLIFIVRRDRYGDDSA